MILAEEERNVGFEGIFRGGSVLIDHGLQAE